MIINPKRQIVVHITTEVIVEEWQDENLRDSDILDAAFEGIWEGEIVHTEIVGEL